MHAAGLRHSPLVHHQHLAGVMGRAHAADMGTQPAMQHCHIPPHSGCPQDAWKQSTIGVGPRLGSLAPTQHLAGHRLPGVPWVNGQLGAAAALAGQSGMCKVCSTPLGPWGGPMGGGSRSRLAVGSRSTCLQGLLSPWPLSSCTCRKSMKPQLGHCTHSGMQQHTSACQERCIHVADCP